MKFCSLSAKVLITSLTTVLLISCADVKRDRLKNPSDDQHQRDRSAQEGKENFKVDRGSKGPQPGKPDKYFKLEKPEPLFDALDYDIQLDFASQSPFGLSYDGEVLLRFSPLQKDFQILELHASQDLKITQIDLVSAIADKQLRFEHQNDQLKVDLDSLFQPNDSVQVRIRYEVRRDYQRGVFSEFRTGEEKNNYLFTQSEPNDSAYWFPSNAFPNDMARFSAAIRVPKPMVALSNGSLLSVQDAGTDQVFYWSQKLPMVSYLFVVTAGLYQQETTGHYRGIPIEHYGYPDDMDRVRYSLRNTERMMQVFSDKIGVEYPYEKYAQIVVPHYQWGGMEHTTATTLSDRTLHSAAVDEQYSSDPLVAHELAHQWFGDLLTCQSWDHLWLNEGFASFFEIVDMESAGKWEEIRFSMQGLRDWYFSEEDTRPEPVVFEYYSHSLDDYFNSRVYGKGAWVLQMLRELVGAETFYKAFRLYTHRYREKLVVTQDLLNVFNDVSGQDLTWFFKQWLYQPGYPKFKARWDYQAGRQELTLEIEQTQDTTQPGGVAGTIPYFEGPLPVAVGSKKRFVVLKPQKINRFIWRNFALGPEFVDINTHDQWLATVEVEQSEAAWQAQIQTSLDPAARIRAARALSQITNGGTLLQRTRLLQTCALSDESEWVQTHCIDRHGRLVKKLLALEEPRNAEVQKYLDQSLVQTITQLKPSPSWRVRRALAWSLENFPTSLSWTELQNLIDKDSAVRVQMAAVEILSKLEPKRAVDKLLALTQGNSFQDRLAISALGALETLASPEAFDRALEIAKDTKLRHGLRTSALGLLASISKNHASVFADKTRSAFNELKKDRYYRFRSSLINAIVNSGDKKSLELLKEMSKEDADRSVRKKANTAAETLEKT